MTIGYRWFMALVPCIVSGTLASAPTGGSDAGLTAEPLPSTVSLSPLFGVALPAGYRQWELIAPSQETGALDELRAILGNPVAMQAYRDAILPFPDGTVLAKVAWKHVPSSEFPPAFVPGAATTVQVMVKDAKRYAATGGWGFGRFVNGRAVNEAQHRTCFPCHAANVKGHDLVFTRFAP